jgi:hypothetical protein
MRIEHMIGWAILGAVVLSLAAGLGGETVKKRIDTATSFVIALVILAIWIFVAIALLRA